jgi:hypothetical protein
MSTGLYFLKNSSITIYVSPDGQSLVSDYSRMFRGASSCHKITLLGESLLVVSWHIFVLFVRQICFLCALNCQREFLNVVYALNRIHHPLNLQLVVSPSNRERGRLLAVSLIVVIFHGDSCLLAYLAQLSQRFALPIRSSTPLSLPLYLQVCWRAQGE